MNKTHINASTYTYRPTSVLCKQRRSRTRSLTV